MKWNLDPGSGEKETSLVHITMTRFPILECGERSSPSGGGRRNISKLVSRSWDPIPNGMKMRTPGAYQWRRLRCAHRIRPRRGRSHSREYRTEVILRGISFVNGVRVCAGPDPPLPVCPYHSWRTAGICNIRNTWEHRHPGQTQKHVQLPRTIPETCENIRTQLGTSW